MKDYNKYKTNSKKISRVSACVIVVIGMILGTVFTFGMRYWNSSVTKDKAIFTEAEFSSYEIIYGRRHSTVKEVKLFFNDREPLFIDGACCNQEVFDKLDTVISGTELQMYLHPNCGELLDIQNNGISILQFDDAVDAVSSEASAFFILGVFMYLFAAAALIKLIRKEIY